MLLVPFGSTSTFSLSSSQYLCCEGVGWRGGCRNGDGAAVWDWEMKGTCFRPPGDVELIGGVSVSGGEGVRWGVVNEWYVGREGTCLWRCVW